MQGVMYNYYIITFTLFNLHNYSEGGRITSHSGQRRKLGPESLSNFSTSPTLSGSGQDVKAALLV